jgi:hypothetical protein
VKDDILQEIWDKGPKEPKMSKAEIQTLLAPQFRKSAIGLRILVWTYLTVIAGTLVCQGMHIYAFRANPVMLTIGILLTSITFGFLAFGIHIIRELTAMEVADESLVAKLRRRLHFHRTKYNIWLWMIALTIALLTFAVSSMPDAQLGEYRINRPHIFIGFTITQILFAYAILKVGQYPLFSESKAILSDLEDQTTTGTDRIKELKKTWRLWSVLFLVLGVILLLWGIFRAIG